MGNKHSSSEFHPDYSNFCLSSPLGAIQPRYDVIVIGSGYGGSVAASRASRAGKKVCILEKGKEWLPGDFPEAELKAFKEVQMVVHGKKDIVGSPTNLFEVVIGPDVAVLQGCGLGGGSLINANVGLDCDPRVFEDEAWPKSFRDDLENLNGQDREHVYDMLKPETYPEEAQPLKKMEAMRMAAEHIVKDIEDINVDDVFKRTPLYVNFTDKRRNHVGVPQPSCIGCGNCCGGCNTGAKNTLNMNYLPDAKAHGADIFTQIEVKYIKRDDDWDGWVVHYIPHVQNAFKKRELIVRAHKVILGAGAIGSTNVLMRSREMGGLEVSSKLGNKFTTNGDTLNFSYNGANKIRPAGVELKKLKEGKAPGPSISCVIDMRNIPGEKLEDGLVLEDGTPPCSADLPYKFLVSWIEKGKDTTPGENDWREFARHWSGKGFKNTLCFLSMSHDNSNGKLIYDDKNQRVWVDYPDVGHEGNFEKVHQTAFKGTQGLKGYFIPNPYWRGLVSKFRDKGGIITVHPLGGCSMGETGAEGVVNHAGQVFKGDTEELHPGLYVVDGSVMPRSLGVNPSMTISVVAERCLRIMAQRNGWRIDYKSWTKIDPSSVMVKPGIRFTEKMRGFLDFADEKHPCEFLLTVESNNVKRFLEDTKHIARIYGTVTCKGLSTSHLTISNGLFQLFSQSVVRVNTREMIYRMVLSSEEGKEYYFDGVKVVHKDSAFEIGVGDTTTLSIHIHEGNSPNGDIIAKGKLDIKLKDFRKQLKTMEVFNVRSRVERLKWNAKFGKFFAGVLWEVFGPFATVNTLFNPDAEPREKRPLKLGDVIPEVTRLVTNDDYELLLTRYEGGSKGPILLVHGTGVGAQIYAIDTIDKNFIEYLVEQEYDVWNLDWRASIYLEGCKKQWNVDDAAKNDFPTAVDFILRKTNQPDIQVFVHCAGGISFFTCLLQGHLQGKIRSIIVSQTGPCLVAGTFNSVKSALNLPSFIHGVGVDGLDAYTTSQDDWMTKAINKFFSGTTSATTPFREHCDSPVCHRITFIYHLLWNHDNLNQLTHETLHETFGYVNSTVFRHFAKSVNKGHVVTFDGEDIYMPGLADPQKGQENPELKKQMSYLDMPILFCSGMDNKCWDPDTSKRSMEACKEANPHQHYERLLIPGYAHLDLFMGKNAHLDVFPLFLPFLNEYSHSSVLPDLLTPLGDTTFF